MSAADHYRTADQQAELYRSFIERDAELPPGDYELHTTEVRYTDEGVLVRWRDEHGDMIEQTFTLALDMTPLLDTLPEPRSPHEQPPTVDIVDPTGVVSGHYEVQPYDPYVTLPNGIVVPTTGSPALDANARTLADYLERHREVARRMEQWRADVAAEALHSGEVCARYPEWHVELPADDMGAPLRYIPHETIHHYDDDIAWQVEAHDQWFDAKDQEVNAELEAWEDFIADTARKARR